MFLDLGLVVGWRTQKHNRVWLKKLASLCCLFGFAYHCITTTDTVTFMRSSCIFVAPAALSTDYNSSMQPKKSQRWQLGCSPPSSNSAKWMDNRDPRDPQAKEMQYSCSPGASQRTSRPTTHLHELWPVTPSCDTRGKRPKHFQHLGTPSGSWRESTLSFSRYHSKSLVSSCKWLQLECTNFRLCMIPVPTPLAWWRPGHCHALCPGAEPWDDGARKNHWIPTSI